MGLNDTNISLGDLLRLTGALVIPSILWGVSVERRFTEQSVKINEIKGNLFELNKKTDEQTNKINQILISIREIQVILKNDK